jgi:flagellar basal-body rod protein FlgC
MFESLNISGSGMELHKYWMDAISDNIANINTLRPTSENAFQARYVLAQAVEDGGPGGGVSIAGITLGSTRGRLVSDPANPLADAQGLVRQPDIDLGEQMTTMMMAQRGYQANISNLDRVRSAYQAAIAMGRN